MVQPELMAEGQCCDNLILPEWPFKAGLGFWEPLSALGLLLLKTGHFQ